MCSYRASNKKNTHTQRATLSEKWLDYFTIQLGIANATTRRNEKTTKNAKAHLVDTLAQKKRYKIALIKISRQWRKSVKKYFAGTRANIASDKEWMNLFFQINKKFSDTRNDVCLSFTDFSVWYHIKWMRFQVAVIQTHFKSSAPFLFRRNTEISCVCVPVCLCAVHANLNRFEHSRKLNLIK